MQSLKFKISYLFQAMSWCLTLLVCYKFRFETSNFQGALRLGKTQRDDKVGSQILALKASVIILFFKSFEE